MGLGTYARANTRREERARSTTELDGRDVREGDEKHLTPHHATIARRDSGLAAQASSPHSSRSEFYE